MTLQQTVSEILNKEVSLDEAKEFANTQFGVLCAYIKDKQFPDGFSSFIETHNEICAMWALAYERKNSKLEEYMESNGTGGMYDCCEVWAFEFENLNKGRQWDGEFFEEIELFFENKVKGL